MLAGSHPEAEKLDLQPLCDSFSDVIGRIASSLAVHRFIDGDRTPASELWRHAAELGWFGLALSERCGGLGLGPEASSLLHRELGRKSAPGAILPTLVVSGWLQQFAPAPLQAELLPRIVAGEVKCALPALLRPAAALAIAGDRVSGRIRMFGSPDSEVLLAPVQSGDGNPAWALLPRTGIATAAFNAWDATREVFDMDALDAEPLAVIRDDGDEAGQALALHYDLALAADSLGAAAGILAQTVEYLKTRVQFGRPVGSFQALKHRVAQHAANLATCSALLQQAVASAESESGDAGMWASMAKAEVCDGCAAIAADCIQLHGGVGHTWEFDVHIFVKRTKLNQMLSADGRELRDAAAGLLIAAAREDRTTLEFQP